MKDWLQKGLFAKQSGLSKKALEVYERKGLLLPHARGENGYRQYHKQQLQVALRIKELKNLGFQLNEIKSLFQADQDLGGEIIISTMKKRLRLLEQQQILLDQQKSEIKKILSSLHKKQKPLVAQQRRTIMGLFGKVSIVVTGVGPLAKTAERVQKQLSSVHQQVPILNWQPDILLPEIKPFILVIEENDLKDIKNIQPDVIIVMGLGECSYAIKLQYLNLYEKAGPHMISVINADDRAAIDLAGDESIRKGRIYYFSKNRGLELQLQKIGGALSDGEGINIYGFNLQKEAVLLKLPRFLPYQDEMALMASLTAVMTFGLNESQLSLD